MSTHDYEAQDEGVNEANDPPGLLYRYDQLVLPRLELEMVQAGYDPTSPHRIRHDFWRLISEGEYDSTTGRSYVLAYLTSIEQQLGQEIRRHSLAYWLHLYRRKYPGPICGRNDRATVTLTRAICDAAFQKFAPFSAGRDIARSNEVPFEEVLGGELANLPVELRAILKTDFESQPSLVLTDFDVGSLRQLYDIEKLAFEAWRASAHLRTLGKGGILEIGGSPELVDVLATDELHRLLESFDSRNSDQASASGVYLSGDADAPLGYIVLPTSNVCDEYGESIKRILDVTGIKIDGPASFYFWWGLFPYANYIARHTPFAEPFRQAHEISLEAVFATIGALLFRVLRIWREKPVQMVSYLWKAYEGPYSRGFLGDEIEYFREIACEAFGITPLPSKADVRDAIAFLSLDDDARSNINLAYRGPHQIFLPLADDYWFIDYAHILNRLHRLFMGVTLDDQNFKADFLESAVHLGISVLPTDQCRAHDGTGKQIDAAIVVGDILVIVECRARGYSIDLEIGAATALISRRQVIDNALRDADDKAKWLQARPVGRNYNVSHYGAILPIGVTPFKEFIPSERRHYWISKDVPRVITPEELFEAMSSGKIDQDAWNQVPIQAHGLGR